MARPGVLDAERGCYPLLAASPGGTGRFGATAGIDPALLAAVVCAAALEADAAILEAP